MEVYGGVWIGKWGVQQQHQQKQQQQYQRQ